MNTGSIQVYERSYSLRAVFGEDNTSEANQFMLDNPETGVIAVRNGWIYIVNLADKGVVIENEYTKRNAAQALRLQIKSNPQDAGYF